MPVADKIEQMKSFAAQRAVPVRIKPLSLNFSLQFFSELLKTQDRFRLWHLPVNP